MKSTIFLSFISMLVAPIVQAQTFEPCHDGVDAWTSSECTKVAAPLDWKKPADRQIEVFVKKIPAKGALQGQIWFVEGGPGSSTANFLEPQIAALNLDKKFPGYELYFMDSRGNGDSTFLECPTYADKFFNAAGMPDDQNKQQILKQCIGEMQTTWEDLGNFSTESAARDLDLMINKFRHENMPVFLYGRSYGTKLAMQYLNISQSPINGIVLDSLSTPENSFSTYDQEMSDSGFGILQLCNQEPECINKFPAGLAPFIVQLFQKLDSGHCPAAARAGFDNFGLHQRLAGLLQMRTAWEVVLPLLYRLDRCAPSDLTAIQHLYTKYLQQLQPPISLNSSRNGSYFLQKTIAFSEYFKTIAPLPYKDAFLQSLVLPITNFTSVAYPLEFAFLWPKYSADNDTWPNTDIPLLILHGQNDMSIAVENARTARVHFTSPHQNLVELPFAGHVAINNLVMQDPSVVPCGLDLMEQFIAQPTSSLDLSCLAKIKAPDLSGAGLDPKVVFGTDDLWD